MGPGRVRQVRLSVIDSSEGKASQAGDWLRTSGVQIGRGALLERCALSSNAPSEH